MSGLVAAHRRRRFDWHQRLEPVAGAQDKRVIELAANDLQADRQAVRRQCQSKSA